MSGTISRPAGAAGEPLEIRPARSRAELKAFIRLPWSIYRDDPHWVAPLLIEVEEFLDPRRHPFYRHGTAEKFVAYRDGRPVGRVLASDDPHYNQQHGTNLGCFGMIESEDDPQTMSALIEAAAQWLRLRGRNAIMGPIDYSTNYPTGLLIDGFDTPPRLMMNHHRPYYAGLLEQAGLTKAKDLYAWWFTDPRNMVSQWRDRLLRFAKRTGVVVRPFNRKAFAADLERCRYVYNTASRDNWGFVKLTDAEFNYLGRQIEKISVQETVYLAEIDGQPVGVSVTVPDLNEAIQPLRGRLTTFGLPIGLIRLLWRMRRVRTVRMVMLDVLQEYRRRGIGELLILETLDFGKNVVGYTGAELSWTLEDNVAVNRMIQAVGGIRYKTYRVYQKSI